MTEQASIPTPTTTPAVSTNPYLVIVAKKSRNLHKKLDKILKADTQQKSGKALNEEQLILLTTRSSVEKQIADIDGIKTLLEEVAASELNNESTTPNDEKENKYSVQEEQLTQMKELMENSAKEAAAYKDEIDQLKQQLKDIEVDRVNSERVLQEMTSALAAAESKNVTSTTTNAASSPDLQATLQVKINKLLKLFHVCARYPGARLPADVNFFGKCLMGETSISGFRETLQECTRKAELYLDDDLCSQFEASRGMTYLDISNLMDELATELGGPPTPPPSEPSSPMINFFTDNDQLVDESFVLEEPALPVATGSNDIIEEHIDAVIEEAKTSLSKEEASQKKKQRSKKPRPKKDNKEQAPNSTSVEASTTPVTGPPATKKQAWGGRGSGAQKEATNASGTSNASTETPSSNGPNKGNRNSKGGAGRGASGPGYKGGRSGRGAGGKSAPVPSSK